MSVEALRNSINKLVLSDRDLSQSDWETIAKSTGRHLDRFEIQVLVQLQQDIQRNKVSSLTSVFMKLDKLLNESLTYSNQFFLGLCTCLGGIFIGTEIGGPWGALGGLIVGAAGGFFSPHIKDAILDD